MFEKIKDMIAYQLAVDPEDVAYDSVMEELGADSLDMVDIVMSIEDEFGFSITDEVFATIITAGDFAKAVEDIIANGEN